MIYREKSKNFANKTVCPNRLVTLLEREALSGSRNDVYTLLIESRSFNGTTLCWFDSSCLYFHKIIAFELLVACQLRLFKC